MHIVLATPLYPPDIADPAPYVKELAKRLSYKHKVSVVLYGRLPEKVDGVNFITIDKRSHLLVRLFLYTIALWKVARGADILYAQNGPSVEFPISIVARLMRKPLIFRIGDEAAHQNTKKHLIFRVIARFTMKSAQVIIDTQNGKEVLSRPEILPFAPKPDDALFAYEKSWDEHLAVLEKLFVHGTQ